MADSQAKIYAELERYIERHASEVNTPEDAQRLVEAFMAEHRGSPADKAANLLSQAEAAKRRGDPAEARGKAKDALKADPRNAAALLLSAKMNAADGDDLCTRLQAAEAAARAALSEAGFFTEWHAGGFWLDPQTRDYIRLRREYLASLVRCGKLRPAVREGTELLRLCEEDGTGVRYVLMHIYAMLEEPEPMERLHSDYDDYEETGMLLPLSVVYYRTGDSQKSAEYLQRLADANPGTGEFIRLLHSGEAMPEPEHFPVRPFTLAELTDDFRQYPEFYSTSRGWTCFAAKIFGFPNS